MWPGKEAWAPSSAVDQIQNFVLGGIISGVIYNSSITILQYIVILLMWTIWSLLLNGSIPTSVLWNALIDSKPTVIIKNGKAWSEACRSKGTFCFRRCLEIAFSQGIFQLKEWNELSLIKRSNDRCPCEDENPWIPNRTDGVVQLKFWKQLGKVKSGC